MQVSLTAKHRFRPSKSGVFEETGSHKFVTQPHIPAARCDTKSYAMRILLVTQGWVVRFFSANTAIWKALVRLRRGTRLIPLRAVPLRLAPVDGSKRRATFTTGTVLRLETSGGLYHWHRPHGARDAGRAPHLLRWCRRHCESTGISAEG